MFLKKGYNNISLFLVENFRDGHPAIRVREPRIPNAIQVSPVGTGIEPSDASFSWMPVP